jgi:hypothetical protein
MARDMSGIMITRNDYPTGWDAWYPAYEDHNYGNVLFLFLGFFACIASFSGQKLTI